MICTEIFNIDYQIVVNIYLIMSDIKQPIIYTAVHLL